MPSALPPPSTSLVVLLCLADLGFGDATPGHCRATPNHAQSAAGPTRPTQRRRPTQSAAALTCSRCRRPGPLPPTPATSLASGARPQWRIRDHQEKAMTPPLAWSPMAPRIRGGVTAGRRAPPASPPPPAAGAEIIGDVVGAVRALAAWPEVWIEFPVLALDGGGGHNVVVSYNGRHNNFIRRCL